MGKHCYIALVLLSFGYGIVPSSAATDSSGPVPKKLRWKVKSTLIKPGNQSEARHVGYPVLPVKKGEAPPFIDGTRIKKEGVILGPNEHYDAMFNPAAFTRRDPKDGKLKVYLVPRAEKDVPDAAWKKRSESTLLESEDGRNFHIYKEGPWFRAGDWYDEVGGTEDARYVDLRLQPYVDIADGKAFDGAMMYTAYDGKTARIAVVFFNHDHLDDTRKSGLLFRDEDVVKNPLVPANPAWNKSASMIQYREPKSGQVKNLIFFGEGNSHHGGIMAMTTERPFTSQADGSFGLRFPEHAKPVITSRPGFYDQALVESAHQPLIARLPKDLADQTGEEFAVILSLHGDTPPWGYSVGWTAFSLSHPERGPIYRSSSPYLRPTRGLEINGQVDKVVFNSAMVDFKGETLLYYGSADTYISVASAPSAPRAPKDPRFTYNECASFLRAVK
jgi:predicted GH43/DUF377 family glycosyl hydrolase